MTYEVVGPNFYVKATNRVKDGWKVCICECRNHVDPLMIPAKYRYIAEDKLQNPFSGKWLGHLLKVPLETSPGMSYKLMRHQLGNYVNHSNITDNLLQKARDTAKWELFGDPNDNVMYAEGIKNALICMGHKRELFYLDHWEVLCHVRVVVVEEEIKRRDANEEPPLSPGAE